jgi:hypothetical protein
MRSRCPVNVQFIQLVLLSTGNYIYIQASNARNICERLDYYVAIDVYCFNLYCLIYFSLKNTSIFSRVLHFYHDKGIAFKNITTYDK